MISWSVVLNFSGYVDLAPMGAGDTKKPKDKHTEIAVYRQDKINLVREIFEMKISQSRGIF